MTKRKGESLTPVEEKLLTDLAGQAGLVLRNVGLTAELLARLEDLRASRQRLVAAQDDERRRLERNLHDGAQQARKATVPVAVETESVDRYPKEVEAAVYFCVLEALQNVQKYAAGSRATVRLRAAADALTFEVEDDGAGFDPAKQAKGSGLQNMADRLDALAGSVALNSAAGRGTRVTGNIPVGRALAVETS